VKNTLLFSKVVAIARGRLCEPTAGAGAIKLPSNVPFSIRDAIHRAVDNSAKERDVRAVGNKRSRI